LHCGDKHARPGAQMAAQAAPSMFDVDRGAAPAAAAEPDVGAAPAPGGAAGAAAPPPRAAPEAAPALGVVSKWTLVDYDDDAAGHAPYGIQA